MGTKGISEWLQARPGIWVWLMVIGVGIIWLTTLQTQMGTGIVPQPHPLVGLLMDDSGEFVVAWHRWGVTHPPGYPLLNGLANLLTAVLGLLSVPPVIAASLVSWGFGLAALVVLARLVWEQGGRFAAAAVVLLPAFGGLTWLYSNVAEVYSLGLLLAGLMLWLALSVGREPTATKAILLGLVCGLAVGHHRTLMLLFPALLLAIWPINRLPWRIWIWAGLAALLSLLVYAYLPLAAAGDSPWIYGRSPATWDGFWDAVLAREYSSQLKPPGSTSLLREALFLRLSFLAEEMSWPGFLGGCLGLLYAWRQSALRRAAAVLGLVFFCYWLVPVGTYLLIGTHLPVMVASLALAGGWGLGLMALAQRLHPAGEKVGVLVAVLLAVWMVAHNRPDIVSHTQDDTGQRLIAAAAALPDTAPILVESWGPRYFALAVGKWVTGELAEARLIDARGNLEGVVAAALPPSPLYTTPYLLYQNPPALWAERLARPVTVESAGPGLIALYPEPRLLPTLPAAGPTEIELQTVTARQEGAMVYVMAEWLAVQKPSVNYHVFVHLTDQPDIDGPDDILAQGDQQNPVYGFSPTTTWVVGQLVRDDYLLTIPDDRQPTQIFIGLYMTTEDGGFVNILRQAVPLAGQ